VQFGECEIFELVLHPVHAEPLRQRRVDVHRLPRDPAAAFIALDKPQRLHVMQPVGELDEQDPNVLGHGEDELAEILGLLCLIGLQLDPRQLGHTINQPCDVRTEYPFDVIEGGNRVFDRIVQQPGHDRRGIELHLGKDARNLDGMGKVRIARIT
jgi:hypothetical protein